MAAEHSSRRDSAHWHFVWGCYKTSQGAHKTTGEAGGSIFTASVPRGRRRFRRGRCLSSSLGKDRKQEQPCLYLFLQGYFLSKYKKKYLSLDIFISFRTGWNFVGLGKQLAVTDSSSSAGTGRVPLWSLCLFSNSLCQPATNSGKSLSCWSGRTGASTEIINTWTYRFQPSCSLCDLICGTLKVSRSSYR